MSEESFSSSSSEHDDDSDSAVIASPVVDDVDYADMPALQAADADVDVDVLVHVHVQPLQVPSDGSGPADAADHIQLNQMILPYEEVYRLAVLLSRGVADAPAVHVQFGSEGMGEVSVFLSHCPWSNYPHTVDDRQRALRSYGRNVDPALLSQLAWFVHETGWTDFVPEEHATILAEALFPSLCACFDHEVAAQDQIEAYAHMICIGLPVRCSSMESMVAYRAQEGRWPTLSEWRDYGERVQSFERDAFYFHDEDRVQVSHPADGIESFGQYVREHSDEADESCPMCFEAIIRGQKVIVLPQCSHAFHARDEECLGNSVLEWFKNERTCPVCRVDISFSDTANTVLSRF